MKLKIWFFTCFLIMLIGSVGASANQDQKISTLEDAIQYAMQNHPDIKILLIERKQNASLKKIAEQIPNPEFDSRLLYGTTESSISGEYSFTHTFEIGGKKDARLERAKLEISLFDKRILVKKQELVCELIFSLYRINQLQKEIDSLQETISTFGQIKKRYGKLPYLNPEQRVSINVFSLAIEEVRIQIRILNSELQFITQKMKLFIGNYKVNQISLLLPRLTSWPTIKPVSIINRSPYLDIVQEELKLGKALYELSKTQAWPDLSIGPSLNTYNSNTMNEVEAGITFSVKVPLYHQNQGEREYFKKGITVHKEKVSSIEKKLRILRNGYARQYSILINKLRNLPDRIASGSKHVKLHRLMRRGVVSAALVIEHHRQENDLLKTYNENQMKAILALWNIYAIDGIIFKEAYNAK